MDGNGMSRNGSASTLCRTSDGCSKRSRSPSTDVDTLFVSQEPSKRVATESYGVTTKSEDAAGCEEVPAATSKNWDRVTNDCAQEHVETSTAIPIAKTDVITRGPLREHTEVHKAALTAVASSSDAPALDTNGRVPGYDVSKEQFPSCGFYLPAFRQVEAIVTRACDMVSDAYAEAKKPNGYSNEAIDIVCGSLAGCRIPSALYPVSGPVAVLGPAGSGKSSATNSIMSQQKVAFEHDGDDRGTYLVHEYRSAPADQLSKYRVVATYYSSHDIKRDVVAYFSDINAKLFEDSDQPSDDSESALEQKFHTALCFFTHLLAHRKEFQSQEIAQEYFESRGDEQVAKVCGDLYGFVEEFLESREVTDGQEVHDVSNEAELQGIFKQMCRPPKARGRMAKEGSPWPVIRKIVVHHDIALLNAGVVLADTPGFNDQNLAVVRNTMRYLKVAGTILIFLTYKRIDQNSPLDQLLRECIALGKMDNIRLVITSIDEMKPLDADDLDPEASALLKSAEVRLQRTLAEIKGTEAAKKQAKGVDSATFEWMDGRLETLQLSKVRAVAAVKQANIEIRCRDMRNTLKGRIQAIDKSRHAPELPISFISNTQYQLHVNGYDPREADLRETPFLDLNATGILQLRQDLLTIPTRGKLHNLKSLIKNRLPNILNGITGILTKSKLERISKVRKIIDRVFLKHNEPVVSLTTEILEAFEKQIQGTIEKSLPAWKDEAQETLTKWAEMNPASFKGFCSRGGEWPEHKKYGETRFRHDLVKIVAPKLTSAFNKLDVDLAGIKKDFSLACQDLFDSVCNEVRNSEDAQGNILGPFFHFVNGTAIEIVEQVIAEFDNLKAQIEMRRFAATLDVAESYFVEGMDATYKNAALLNSTTHVPKDLPVAQRAGKRKLKAKRSTVGHGRVKIILSKLRGETGEMSIFLTVGQNCKHDIEAYMKTWAEGCNAIIEKGYGNIIAYFENRFQEEEVKEEEDPMAVESIKNAVVKASELLQSAVYHIDECEAYEESGK